MNFYEVFMTFLAIMLGTIASMLFSQANDNRYLEEYWNDEVSCVKATNKSCTIQVKYIWIAED